MMDPWAAPLLGLLAGALLSALALSLLRRPRGSVDLSTPLQNLTQAVNNVQVELRGMAERVSRIEQDQSHAGRNIVALGTELAQTEAASRSSAEHLIQATSAIRAELLQFDDGFGHLSVVFVNLSPGRLRHRSTRWNRLDISFFRDQDE